MKLNLFSVPIFIDNIDSSKIDIKNQNFEKTWNSETISSFNSTNLLDKESVNYLLGIISNSISKEFNETLKIQLLNIWENRYTDNDFQEKHTHPQAPFSFIIFSLT